MEDEKEFDEEAFWKDEQAEPKGEPDPEPEETPPVEAEGEPPPQEEPDLAAQLAEERRKREDLEHRYKSDLGRVQAAQRVLHQPQQALRDTVSEALKDPEKWTALKNDYPEIAEAIEARDSSFKESIRQSVLQEIQEPLARLKQREKDLTRQAEESALTARHPDWRELSATTEFENWLTKQPLAVQELRFSDYAADAAYLIDTFKATQHAAVPQRPATTEAAEITEQRKKKLEMARTVPQKGAVNVGLPKDDFDEVFSAIT